MRSGLQMTLYEQRWRILNCLKQNKQNREDKQHTRNTAIQLKRHTKTKLFCSSNLFSTSLQQ